MEDNETGNGRRVFGRVVEDLSINRSSVLEEMAFLVALIVKQKQGPRQILALSTKRQCYCCHERYGQFPYTERCRTRSKESWLGAPHDKVKLRWRVLHKLWAI